MTNATIEEPTEGLVIDEDEPVDELPEPEDDDE